MPVLEEVWNETRVELGRRASFELECPERSLEFVLIAKDGRRPSEVGVTGCGRREVYARVGRTWFSSGQGDAAGAAQRQLQIQQQQQQRSSQPR